MYREKWLPHWCDRRRRAAAPAPTAKEELQPEDGLDLWVNLARFDRVTLPVSRRKCEAQSVRVSRSEVLLRLWARVPVADSRSRASGRLPRVGNDGGPQGSRSRGFSIRGGRPRRAQPPIPDGIRGAFCTGESHRRSATGRDFGVCEPRRDIA